MAKIIDFRSRKQKNPVQKQVSINDHGIVFQPIDPEDFDFTEELTNLLGITQDLDACTTIGQVKHILSDAIEAVMTWPDNGG